MVMTEELQYLLVNDMAEAATSPSQHDDIMLHKWNTSPHRDDTDAPCQIPDEDNDIANNIVIAAARCGEACFCADLHTDDVRYRQRDRLQSFLIQTVLILLNIPCAIYEAVRRAFTRCCGKEKGHRELFFGGADCGQQRGQSPITFGDNTSDLLPLETQVAEYREQVGKVKESYSFAQNGQAWGSMDEELTIICENGFTEKLSVWLEFFSQEDQETFTDWWTDLLAKAMLAGQMQVSKMWLQQFPDMSFVHLKNGPYAGLTPMHLAITKHQIAHVEGMLYIFEESTATIWSLIHQKMTKDMAPAIADICPCAELPLNLAVWMGDEDIVQTLVDSGAEMVAEDSNGNNALHTVILLAEVNKTLALKMLDCLLALIPVWTVKSTTCGFLGSLNPVAQLKHGKQLLFLAQNKDGFTPLTLAARSGQPELVDRIMNIDDVYRFHYLDCGANFSALYDMTGMDPRLGDNKAPGVMESAAMNRTIQHLRMFEVPTVQKLRQQKHTAFRPFMVIATLLHLSFMGVFSVAAYFKLFPRLLTVENQSYYDDDDGQSSTILRFSMHTVDYVLLIAVVVVMMYCCVASWYIWFPLRRRNKIKLKKASFLGHILTLDFFLAFCLCGLLYLILKVCESSWEVIYLSCTLSAGWCSSFLYTRLFKTTAHFSVMLEHIMLKDMLRFLLVIFLSIVAFSMSILTLLAVDYDLQANDLTLGSLGWRMFEVTAGVTSIQHLVGESTHCSFLKWIYFSFLLYMPILMINLLIAAMNHTYSELSTHAHLLYQSIQLADALVLEAVLPSCLQRKGVDFYTTHTTHVYDKGGQLHERQLYLLELESTVKEENDS